MTLDPHVLVIQLRLVGAFMALLVIVNLVVPGCLGWREEMSRLSLVNRQIFQVHSIFIALMIGLFSALLLTSADALLEPSRLSRAVLIGLTIFWALRMLVQWFFYSAAVWRGSRFRTAVHYVFSAAWIWVTTTCAAALWINLSS